MPDSTPGEYAYAAWFHAAGLTHLVAWTQLRPDAQACWEAAAEAVLDAWLAQPRMETPPPDRGPGQARPLHTEDHDHV